MPRKRDSPEQMITKLRQAEVELSRGLRLQEAGRQRADVLLGLIRSCGHFPKGGYDVHDGTLNEIETTASAVH